MCLAMLNRLGPSILEIVELFIAYCSLMVASCAICAAFEGILGPGNNPFPDFTLSSLSIWDAWGAICVACNESFSDGAWSVQSKYCWYWPVDSGPGEHSVINDPRLVRWVAARKTTVNAKQQTTIMTLLVFDSLMREKPTWGNWALRPILRNIEERSYCEGDLIGRL